MKKRQTPLTIPPTRIYVEVDVPGRETHHFRLPRMAQALELLELLPREETERTVEVLGEGHTMRERMQHYADLEERVARILGALWWHPELELESKPDDYAALAEEFHEAGYAPTELYSMCLSLMGPLATLLVPAMEVKQNDGFFGETHGGAETPQ